LPCSTRMDDHSVAPRSPVRTRPLPLPRYRAPGAVAGSHAADGSAPRARCWSRRPVGGLHHARPGAPSSRSPGRTVRTRATAPPGCARIAPDHPSDAGIPVHRVDVEQGGNAIDRLVIGNTASARPSSRRGRISKVVAPGVAAGCPAAAGAPGRETLWGVGYM
jgi:hypothetical protein